MVQKVLKVFLRIGPVRGRARMCADKQRAEYGILAQCEDKDLRMNTEKRKSILGGCKTFTAYGPGLMQTPWPDTGQRVCSSLGQNALEPFRIIRGPCVDEEQRCLYSAHCCAVARAWVCEGKDCEAICLQQIVEHWSKREAIWSKGVPLAKSLSDLYFFSFLFSSFSSVPFCAAFCFSFFRAGAEQIKKGPKALTDYL